MRVVRTFISITLGLLYYHSSLLFFHFSLFRHDHEFWKGLFVCHGWWLSGGQLRHTPFDFKTLGTFSRKSHDWPRCYLRRYVLRRTAYLLRKVIFVESHGNSRLLDSETLVVYLVFVLFSTELDVPSEGRSRSCQVRLRASLTQHHSYPRRFRRHFLFSRVKQMPIT